MSNQIIPVDTFIEGVRRDIEAMHGNDPRTREIMYDMALHMFGVDFRVTVENIKDCDGNCAMCDPTAGW